MTNFKPARNQVIDLMRGYFLFIIGVDHAYLNPNLWNFVTGQNLLWVSAAEGFFFISGLMTGIVRGQQISTKGWSAVINKIYQRAITLYLCSVGLTIALTFLGWWVGDPVRVKNSIYHGATLWMIVDAIQLRYVYGWIDFLPYYVVFLMASPLVLWLLTKKLWWVIVGASFSIWWFGRTNPYAAWQIIFMAGLVVGYHWSSICQYLDSLKAIVRDALESTIVALTITTIVISVIYVHYPQISNHFSWLSSRSTIDWIMMKEQLGPGRIILFGIWFAGVYIVFRRTLPVIDHWLGWLLISLGQNSLTTYVVQAGVLFGLKILWPGDYGQWGNTAWIALEILITWLIINRQHIRIMVLSWRQKIQFSQLP